MKRLCIPALASALLGATAAVGADDLESTYRLALQNDPVLRAAQHQYAAAAEALPQARAGLLPTLNANAFTTQHSEELSPGGSSDYNNSGFGLTLTQPLYRKDNFARYRQSGALVVQAAAELAAARQATLVRVAERYFAHLAALDGLEFAQREKAAIARQLEQAQQRFKVGLIAITDVHEAQARFDQAVAQEIGAENELANARETLREVTGQHPGEPRTLGEALPLVRPDPADADQWTRQALDQNAGVQSLRAAVESAREAVEIGRAGHTPALDLVAGYTDADTEGGVTGALRRKDTEIGLVLSVPLYAGGGTQAGVRAARARLEQAIAELDRERRAVESRTRRAYLGVVANLSQVHAFEQALVSSQSALQATEAGLQVGTRTIVDVLNAQRELYRARRDLSRARYDYVLNGLRLREAAGTLAEGDLLAVNGWLKH